MFLTIRATPSPAPDTPAIHTVAAIRCPREWQGSALPNPEPASEAQEQNWLPWLVLVMAIGFASGPAPETIRRASRWKNLEGHEVYQKPHEYAHTRDPVKLFIYSGRLDKNQMHGDNVADL